MKERRGGGRSDDPSLGLIDRRSSERRGRGEWDDVDELDAFAQQPTRLERLVLDGIRDPELAQKLRSRQPCKVTRVELEMALAERPRTPMTPEAALSYAKWMLSSERGWSSARAAVKQDLQDQLLTAAETGAGVKPLLTAADPEVAETVLRELRSATVPGRVAPALRLVTQEAGEEVGRLLNRGASGEALPAEVAARLAPHVGADAVRAARLHTDDNADLFAAAHDAHAVTLGDHIYLAHGEYAPGTEAGDDLLVHELTHVAQAQRGELFRAAAKGLGSGSTLDPAEAEAELRANLAVVELHAPTAPAPTPAAPKGQPTSDGERQARITAQQQRLTAAKQDQTPDAPAKRPPPLSAQKPVAHPGPELAPPPKVAAAKGDAYEEALEAPPSRQATELWGNVGTKATMEAQANQAAFSAGLPPMPIQLEGAEDKAAKGGGAAAQQPKPKAPAGPVPPSAKPAATPQPKPVNAAANSTRKLQELPDKSRMQAEGKKAMAALPTTSPAIKTDPGTPPVADLAGQADPARTNAEQQTAFSDGAKALDAEKKKVLAGKGAAHVQPKQLDEKLEVPRVEASGPMPELPKPEGMDKFKKWNLPTEVQGSFDAVAKPKMDASLAQAKSKMNEAEAKRDADREKAVTDAQDKVKKAHADADAKQQAKIAESRTQITNKQAETLSKQQAEVQKLDNQSGEKKQAALAKIDNRIKSDQAKVDADYDAAQKKAEAEKRKGEEEAARKKKEAQEKAEKEKSWWDRVADAVCDAIQAIADAIDKALEAVGKAIGGILDAVKNAACAVIDAARDFVCAALEEFGSWLKSAVTALLGSVFPELAATLNKFIDNAINAAKAAVNAIADGLKKAVTAYLDGLKAAVNAAIAAFRAGVQAAATFAKALVTGDWAMVAKMALEAVLRLLGIDPQAFYALVGKAEATITKILEDPGAFVGHLVDAVKLGFKQFGANFLTHLKDGVLQWLFGTFAEAGIRMPAHFDIAGVFDLTCQVLGLTWPRLRGKVVKVIGEKNTERFEFVAGYIEALVTGGFAGLWEKVQQDLSSLWDTVIGGAKQWLMEKLVQQAIVKIATMWNPAGAIIQLIQTAWNVYCWVKENAQRIFGLIQAVVDSVSNIASGNIAGAANYIESSLARLIPVAISLFANLLGLGGIADKIKGIITKIQTKVDKAIEGLIERVLKAFKGKDRKKDEDKRKKKGAKEDEKNDEIEDDSDKADDKKDPEKQAELKQRLEKARQEIRRQLRGRRLSSRKGKKVVSKIAGKYGLQHQFNFSNQRWHLVLKINPRLDDFFPGNDGQEVRQILDKANISVTSLQTKLTKMYNELLEGKKRTRSARDTAMGDVLRAVGGVDGLRQTAASDPDLEQRQHAAKAGNRFQSIYENEVQKEAEAAGRLFVGSPTDANGAGFDAAEIDLESSTVSVHEVKNGSLRTLVPKSSSRGTSTPKNRRIAATSDGEKGSLASQHLRAKPEDADKLANDHVLMAEGKVLENKLSAITSNLISNLERLEAQLMKAQALDPDNMPKYQQAIALVRDIRNNEGGNLVRVVSVKGAIVNTEKAAASTLLNGAKQRLRNVNIADIIRAVDADGKVIEEK